MGATRTERARQLRRNQTEAEDKLWHELRGSKLGHKFRRQHPIGPYIADFACITKGLVVELDGGQHAEESARLYDAERTAYINAAGFKVVRFWNNEVLGNMIGVLEVIEGELK
ncbi:MAG: endonuclease domain-containing protein [Deinococcus sp.]|uniref:endonuclease domain-containing protein n=1 Tax=Deinococcus sp. TaxID=47478 RepID=UPI0026DB2CD2|nr:endonuclease domain-containing protein [Deinococcus sp.]MDO4245108.1 endonuclease domain-containing protein [Deinococcus sp.]